MEKTRGIDLPQPELLNLPIRDANFTISEDAVLKATTGETTEPYIFLIWDNDDYFLYSCNANAWFGNDTDVGDSGFSASVNTVMEYDLSAGKIYFGNNFDEWHVSDFSLSDGFDLITNATNLTTPAAGGSGRYWAKAVHPDTTRNASAPDDDTIFWTEGYSELRAYSISGNSWTTKTDTPQNYPKMFWLPDVDPTKLYFITLSGSSYARCYEYDIATDVYTQVGSDTHPIDLSAYSYTSHWCSDDQFIYAVGTAHLNDDDYFGGAYVPVYRYAPDPVGDNLGFRVETWLPVSVDTQDSLNSGAYPYRYYSYGGSRIDCVTIGSTKYLYWLDLPNDGASAANLTPKFWRVELI